MTEIDRIIDELQREYEGEPWHGYSLLHILGGLTAPQAAARPVTGAHSVWELVLHMTAWKNEVRRRLGGAPAGNPSEGDWPTVTGTSEQEWKSALTELQRAHADLVKAIRAFPEETLDTPTQDPRNKPTNAGVSHYVLLHGAVQHDVYHAGQVALLRKALASSNAATA